MKGSIFAAVFLFAAIFVHTVRGEDLRYQELGQVNWNRKYDAALATAGERGVPVFILFQEVPGCATCVDYGLLVLSHPLVVEAIETLFVPLAIYNNRGGTDAEVMRLFQEPSWNNPVVRIVDSQGRELTKRVAGDYSIAGTTGAMIGALEKSNIPVPEYLRIVHEENSSLIKPGKAVFSTFCFWSGEIELGKIAGIVATRAGFMQGREVVEVQYNTSVLSYAELLRKVKRNRCARKALVFTDEQERVARSILGSDRVAPATTFYPDSNIKYYMSKTPYRYIPVTSRQAILINRAVYEGKNPEVYLSPQQRSVLAYIKRNPKKGWKSRINDPDFTTSWNEVLQKVESYK